MTNRDVLACQVDELNFPKYGELLNEVAISFAAKGENVALARTIVSAMIAGTKFEQWDVTLSTLEEIKVAVSEAVSNAIIHGYGGNPKENVHMTVEQYEQSLVVVVSDTGCGIVDIEQAMEADFTTGDEHLGLGFAFMSSFMDEVEVDSMVGQGTKITLVKNLPNYKVG